MRIAVLIIAGMAVAAAKPAAAEPTIQDAVRDAQRVLDDPRNEKALRDMADALGEALLSMEVGAVQAASEGRTATEAEKKMTLREALKIEDPTMEAKLKRSLSQSLPALKQGMRALSSSLPALTQSLEALGKSVEKIGANLPDPTYPKR